MFQVVSHMAQPRCTLMCLLSSHLDVSLVTIVLLDIFQIRIQRLDKDLLILSPRGETGAVGDQALVTAWIKTGLDALELADLRQDL